jgi:hypothetical protein
MKSLKSVLFACGLIACSGGLNGEIREADPSAALLPLDVGVFINESSLAYDAAALEVILPGKHERIRTEGFGLDIDMQARHLVDPSGAERIFTLHATQGVIVERDRSGAMKEGRWSVFDKGRAPNSANPRDAAFAPDGKLWITRYAQPTLLILDTGDGTTSTIDLGAFADADGKPEMSAIAIVGDTAYVALRRLEDGFGTTKNDSQVIAIDTKTRIPRAFVTLPAKNPIDRFRQRNGALWISCIGGPLSKPADENAALIRIDLATATATKAFDAKAAGGFIPAFDIVDDELGYAIVAAFTEENPTSVVRFNPSRGALLDATPWVRTSGYALWDIGVLPNAELVLVADRSKEAPGLQILSIRDRGAKVGLIPTRLEPTEFFFLRSPVR